MSIRIETFKQEHLEEITALEQQCFETPWSKATFEKELDNSISAYFVALSETGHVVGYAGVWMMVDVGNITNIAVAPSYRCRGIGRMLLSRLIESCMLAGMASITLEVREGNQTAIALYSGMGFHLCGRRRRYYQGKEDALLMTRMLIEDTP